LLAIKAAVDKERSPGRFLLTGSANVLLLPKVSESLAGRMELHTLWPFSQGELGGVRETFVDRLFKKQLRKPELGDTPNIFEQAMRGGYPEIQSRSQPRRRDWFGSYVTTILQRDVRDMGNIQGLTELPQLLRLLAARSAQLLNFSDLARSMTIPQSTLKRYMALLEATFLVQLLPAWFTNIGKRLVKAPKLIMVDTGLVASLLGIDARRLEVDSTLKGHLLENFLIMEIRKQAAWSQTRPELFHYRTHSQHEVDLVLEDAAGRIVGIEIKASSTIKTAALRGMHDLAESAGDRFVRGVILYLGDKVVPMGANLHAMPLQSVWA
jgi:predicted AAA+ superfamily ATPase